MIQVDEDIASVSVPSVRLEVHSASLAIAHTQKADGREIRQLVCCPQPLAGERPSGAVVNQTDEVKLVWHRRQLATDGLRGKSESAVKHAPNSAIELGCRTMKSQRTGNSVLTHCLSRRAHPILCKAIEVEKVMLQITLPKDMSREAMDRGITVVLKHTEDMLRSLEMV